VSLKKQALSGIFWTTAQQFVIQIINFIVTVVLARLLSPGEFGLIAMLSIFIAIGATLIDSGLTTSLLRTANLDQKDYSTVFFINLIASVLIYFILFFCSPFIAKFYHQPILTGVIRLYTLSFIIGAFESVQRTKLTKEMDFKKQMTVQIPSYIGGSIVGLILAYKNYGVWSLVWMNLSQTFFSTCQLWIRTDWRPQFIFNSRRFKHHFLFSYKITLSQLLNTIFDNLYNLVIGKYFSAATLGYYNRAIAIRQLPVSNISTALNKVTFPLFAAMQSDNEKLKDAYKKLMQQVLFWITPLLIFLGIITEPLFRLLLTEKWLPAVPYFRFLIIPGILYPLHAYNLNILNVKGRSDLFLKLEIIKKVIISIGIFFAIPFGIYGLLGFQIITSIVAFYINTFYSGKLINYPIGEQLKSIAPTLIISSLVGLVIFFIDQFLVHLKIADIFRMLIDGVIFSIIYFITNWLIKLPALSDFIELILKNDTRYKTLSTSN